MQAIQLGKNWIAAARETVCESRFATWHTDNEDSGGDDPRTMTGRAP
jgi:hypothetical protein